MVTQKKQYQLNSEAQKACGEYLASIVDRHEDKRIVFFYSGGSSLAVLPFFTEAVWKTHPDRDITFCAVDERFDPYYSNFVTLKREYSDFYAQCLQHGCQFIDTSPHQTDQYNMAAWLEKEVTSTLFSRSEKAKPFVLTLLGMGIDGHIAGILPYPENEIEFDSLFASEKLFVGYDAAGKSEHTKRCTLTYTGLQENTILTLFASGEKKIRLLKDIEKNEYPFFQKPVSYLYKTTLPVALFTSFDTVDNS